MQPTVECLNCKKTVPANVRLKGEQNYCGCKDCQNKKKRIWYRNKIATDPEYAKRQKECKKRWRNTKPNHQYMAQYRQTHPDYVKKNREQQRERNKKLREKQNKLPSPEKPEKIVKIDALDTSCEKPRIYEMKILTPERSEKIVKIDALLVELAVYQDDTG